MEAGKKPVNQAAQVPAFDPQCLRKSVTCISRRSFILREKPGIVRSRATRCLCACPAFASWHRLDNGMLSAKPGPRGTGEGGRGGGSCRLVRGRITEAVFGRSRSLVGGGLAASAVICLHTPQRVKLRPGTSACRRRSSRELRPNRNRRRGVCEERELGAVSTYPNEALGSLASLQANIRNGTGTFCRMWFNMAALLALVQSVG